MPPPWQSLFPPNGCLISLLSPIYFFGGVLLDTDERTENEKILDALNAALLNRATSDQNAYMIGTRRLDRIPLEELRRLRGTFVTAVRFEKGKAFGSVRVKI